MATVLTTASAVAATVSVRRATLEDRPAIFAFIKRAWPQRWQFKIPDRWDWEFVSNPFLEPGEMPVWIALDAQGEVVGQSAALIEPLKLGAQVLRAGWGVDAYVDPRWRGLGIARRLQAANCGAHDIFASLSMAPAMRRLKEELGAARLSPVTVYLRAFPLDRRQAASAAISHLPAGASALKQAAGELLGLTHLDAAAAALYNARRSRHDERLIRAAARDVSVVEVEAFDAEVDTLWESVSAHFDALARRDHRYLNWKYVQQPHIRYHRLLARRNGRLCGLLILRKTMAPEPRMGIVTDLFVSPADTAAIFALLSRAIIAFRDAGAACVMAATNVAAYQDGLGTFGFTRIRDEVPVVGSRTRPEIVQRATASRWLLGKGDQDWDQYPLASLDA